MENNILYINSCVRKESRTDRLAKRLLQNLGDYTEINLCEENLLPLDKQSLARRDELISKGSFDDDMFRLARQFASADIIVIGAPLWDLSFPALLKIYLENIYVTGIVSRYGEDGKPVGLCKANKIYYVTTAGGPYVSTFSYDLICGLAKTFGINSTELIYAENLDIFGNDPEKILREVVERRINKIESIVE